MDAEIPTEIENERLLGFARIFIPYYVGIF